MPHKHNKLLSTFCFSDHPKPKQTFDLSNSSYVDPLFVLNAPLGTSPLIDLHPRKRKIRASREGAGPTTTINAAALAAHIPASSIFVPPLEPMLENEAPVSVDQLTNNQYSMYLMLQKKIDDKMGIVRPVKTKAPNGPKKWILQERTYALASNTPAEPTECIFPPGMPTCLQPIFQRHNRERYKEHLNHRVQRERIIATYENEVLREYGRAVSVSFCGLRKNIHSELMLWLYYFVCSI